MINMKNNIVLCGLAALAVAVTGCNSDSKAPDAGAGGSTASSAKPVKIGFIVKSMSDSWFQTETGFAKDEAKKIGVDPHRPGSSTALQCSKPSMRWRPAASKGSSSARRKRSLEPPSRQPPIGTTSSS